MVETPVLPTPEDVGRVLLPGLEDHPRIEWVYNDLLAEHPVTMVQAFALDQQRVDRNIPAVRRIPRHHQVVVLLLLQSDGGFKQRLPATVAYTSPLIDRTRCNAPTVGWRAR